ncbi:MAG: hypothetical protein IJL99_01185 [Firmicutes bacterium]|nr:hypothetical protein [Bacillota bacterium]
METITQAAIDIKTMPTASQNIIAAQLFRCASKAFENKDVQRQYQEWKKQEQKEHKGRGR